MRTFCGLDRYPYPYGVPKKHYSLSRESGTEGLTMNAEQLTRSTPATGVPVTDMCPSWCRHPHGALLVPDGEGSDHHGAPILDDGTMTVQVTCWVDNVHGQAVPEPSHVYVGVGENDFTPVQVRTLIDALTAALKVIEDEQVTA